MIKRFIKDTDKPEEDALYAVLQTMSAFKGPATSAEANRHKERIFRNLNARIAQEPPRLKPFRKIRIFGQVAAIVILLISVGIGSYKMAQTETEVLRASMVELFNPAGSITTLYLPDSTKVVLNHNSKIVYPSFFANHERRVKVEGEAFFEVTKDTERPFLVETSDLDIRVLGTKFNLEAYEDDSETMLSLLEGKVEALSKIGECEHLLVTKGQQLILDKKNGTLQKQNIQMNAFPQWQKGELIYRNESLKRIFKDLEHRFNVNIEITNEGIGEQHYFVSFRNGESLEQILTLLSYRKNWVFKKDNNQIKVIYR